MSFKFDKNYKPPPQTSERAEKIDSTTTSLSSAAFSGLELIVKHLDHSAPGSAFQHLNNLVKKFNETERIRLVAKPCQEWSATQNPIDFAFLAVSQPNEIRPDILYNLIDYLNGVWKDEKGVKVEMKVTSGWDKTRMAVFRLETPNQSLDAFKSKMDSTFKSHQYRVQATWTNEKARKVWYVFLDDDVCQKLRDNPPFFPGFTHQRGQDRFIIPTYPLEVTVNNVGEIPMARNILDAYITRTYGDDALRWSRLCDNDNVYCAVLSHPSIVQAFLDDPCLAFDPRRLPPGHVPSDPRLLYSLNCAGLSEFAFRDRSTQETNVHHAQTESHIHRLQGELSSVHGVVSTLAEQYTQLTRELMTFRSEKDKQEGAMFLYNSLLSQVNASQSRIDNLSTNTNLMMMMIPVMPSPEIQNQILQQRNDLNTQLREEQAKHDRLQEQLNNIQVYFQMKLPDDMKMQMGMMDFPPPSSPSLSSQSLPPPLMTTTPQGDDDEQEADQVERGMLVDDTGAPSDAS
ncbi:hypothetical protein D9611_001789 [Ephemerocybe angulata]|uniref:Uncharacterized protein n=1 Tax=Ephemerocybe angulata TaxID=980116 RepID=A0A8H5CIQ8_9AGAR|nr:hypothetical protein D9611_001789 [Tulosesus angulatus]